MKRIISSPFTFLSAGLLFILCTYWIYKNVTLEDLVGRETSKVTSNLSNDQYPEKIEIRNNNVVKVISTDLIDLIVEGDSLEDMESLSNLSVSPDGRKMCFLVHTITPIWLYISDYDGNNIKRIDIAKNCAWSPDSKYIAYNNHTTDVSPVDLNVYDVSKGEIKNLTSALAKPGYMRNYSTPVWDNNVVIRASYIEFKVTDVSIQKEDESIINVITGEELETL